MNAVIEMPSRSLVQGTGRLSATEVVQHALVVQEVLRAVMKPDVHYGKIPGTDKQTLFQPGADVLCMTFRIAPEFTIEDLSTVDAVRYRVTCRGVHQLSGVTLGSCVGEASSGEEKYKWRRAASEKEYELTAVTHRRIKYGKSWETKQVRTEPADVANTVLKMAEKRAKIGMVLNVTACSDMFGQDLEDLDETLRDSLVGGDQPPPQTTQADPAIWPANKFAEQLVRWTKAIQAGLKTHDEIISLAKSKGELTVDQIDAIRTVRTAPKDADQPAE